MDRDDVTEDVLNIEIEDSRGSATTTASKSVIISTGAGNNVIKNKVTTTPATTGYVTIAPRTATSSTSVTTPTTSTAIKASNGKIIYLQRPGGSSVSVRLPATIASNNAGNSNQSKPTVAIHVIRTANGSLVPIKSGKGINIPNMNQLTGKKVITTSSGQVVIKTPIKPLTGSLATQSTPATVTSCTASSEDEIKTKIIPIVNAKPTNNCNLSPATSKLLLQNATVSKPIVVPPNLIKLSPTTQGGAQIKTVQISGKAGVQYVRVLGNNSGISHKVTKTEKPTVAKYAVVRQTNKPQMRIVINSPTNDKEQKIITTVPTLRKLSDGQSVQSTEMNDPNLPRSAKISQINSQIRGLSSSTETKPDSSQQGGNRFIVVPKSLIRNSITSQSQNQNQNKNQNQVQNSNQNQNQNSSSNQNQAVTQQNHHSSFEVKKENDSLSPPPMKKLYAVLKPEVETKEARHKVKTENVGIVGRSSRVSSPEADDTTVAIRRKHCNCTKSQCLKLYCDCFANGEFCQDCNCRDCLNNLENQDERQKAIRICLERNPNSFKPKITAATSESDQRQHNKGCNCKRSSCLKNYCECYEAKVPCSSNCKCLGCRNIEEHPDLDMDSKKNSIPKIAPNRMKRTYEDLSKPKSSNALPASPSSAVTLDPLGIGTSPIEKQPCNFITQEVVDATIQCLIAQADECKRGGLTPCQTERMVMEELGRCLVEIIDFSIRNTDQN